MHLQDLIAGASVPLGDLSRQSDLVRELQQHFSALGLYPGGEFIDGIQGPRSRGALHQFCQACGLDQEIRGVLDRAFAEKLLATTSLPSVLADAADRPAVQRRLLAIAQSWQSLYRPADDRIGLLAFLDRGIRNSRYRDQPPSFRQRLEQPPDPRQISLPPLSPAGAPATFPARGVPPAAGFEQRGLDFLDPRISSACVCISGQVGGQAQVSWLGRQARALTELYSATKFLPVLHALARVEQVTGQGAVNLETCAIRGRYESEAESQPVLSLIEDIVTYDETIGSSNAIAALFKRLTPYADLENWIRAITGSAGLQFRGHYGETPYRSQPVLFDTAAPAGDALLRAPDPAAAANPGGQGYPNRLSCYDLTRVLAMLAWHPLLPFSCRLPGWGWPNLARVIRVLGDDRARYADVAIETLGLAKELGSPVLISKLGLGNSRDLVYAGYLQVDDQRRAAGTGLATRRAMAFTLKLDGSQVGSFIEADGRLAAEFTELLRRFLAGSLV